MSDPSLNSVKVEASILKKMWVDGKSVNKARQFVALETLLTKLKQPIEDNSDAELESLNAVKYDLVRSRYQPKEGYRANAVFNDVFGNLNKSGKGIFPFFIIWLGYYHPAHCKAFLDEVFAPGEWRLGLLSHDVSIGLNVVTWPKPRAPISNSGDVDGKGAQAISEFAVPSPPPTSKRHSDCEILKDFAHYATGIRSEENQRRKLDNFFEEHAQTPGWFAVAELPKEEFSVILWSAVNTLCHAVSDPSMLEPRQFDRLIQFVQSQIVEVPDLIALKVSNKMQEIRDDCLPTSSRSSYRDFHFIRTLRTNPHSRRMRMIQKERPNSYYMKPAEELYQIHATALELLVDSQYHLEVDQNTYEIDLSMALASAIHAQLINPSNTSGVDHPLISNWYEQLVDIAERHSAGLIQSVLAELQMAAFDADQWRLRETLENSINRFSERGLEGTVLFRALQLGRLAYNDDFFLADEARDFLSKDVIEQQRFMHRSNIGIVPVLRDKFVAHHEKRRTLIAPIVRQRFGSDLS